MKKLALSLILVLLSPSAWAGASSVRETPVVKVIRECSPRVVNIGTEQTVLLQQNPFWGAYGGQLDAVMQNHLDQFNQVVGTANMQSLGSGVVVSKDGLIVTNAHVVGKASKILVTFSDGKKYEARLIGMDNANDIALIQVPVEKPLEFMEMATDVLVGETVVSIGNPLGLENSASSGIVSGTNRSFNTNPPTVVFHDLIQTDASINIGSSGGALINLEGKLAGINLAVMQNAQGLGFAVPAEKVKKMLQEYEKVKPTLKP